MPGRLERVLDHRLSRMDGDYDYSCDDAGDYFEVEISWSPGSEQPSLKELALHHLLPLKGFRSGLVRQAYTGDSAWMYVEEDEDTAYQVVEEALPGLLERKRN